MQSDSTLDFDQEERLNAALLVYLQAEDDGRRPDPALFLKAHPGLTTELAAFLADQDQIATLLRPLRAQPPAESTPNKWPCIPDFEIVGVVDGGGMGIVYKAWQNSLERQVALKRLRNSRWADAAEHSRLKREAQNAARLSHPNIVPIFQVGEWEGEAFFSMGFIEGGTLAQKFPGPVSDQRAVARLFALAARAVHHAHQRGVLHRDLKPANILIDAAGQPHITDFGLAHRLDAAAILEGAPESLTLEQAAASTRGVCGTPAYMAPEQTLPNSGPKSELTTAVDIHGLGATLYHLLTGQAPFRGPNLYEVLRQAREVAPTPPRKLHPAVARDLEKICLKCLHKEPAKRYGSAEELAKNLDAFADGRPIQDAPVSRRLFLLAKRRPLNFALGTAAVLLALFALGFGVYDSWKTEGLLALANDSLYASLVRQAENELSLGRPDRADQILDECPKNLHQWEWYYLKRRSHREPVTLVGHPMPIQAMHYSPDGRQLVTASQDGLVIVWDSVTGQERVRLSQRFINPYGVCFVDAGRKVVTATEDQTVRVWNAANGELLQELPKAGAMVAAAEGKRFAAANSTTGVVTIWTAGESQPLYRLPAEERLIRAVALSPDGRRVAIGGFGNLLKVRELDTGRELALAISSPKPVSSLAFSPDGKNIAAGAADLREYDAETGTELGEVSESGDFACLSISYSKAGEQRIAATDRGGNIRIWERPRGRSVLGTTKEQGHGRAACALFNPADSRYLAVVREQEVTIEDLNPELTPASQILLADDRLRFQAMALSPDGKWLAARARAGERTAITLLRMPAGTPVRTQEIDGADKAVLVFTPDSTRLIAAGTEGRWWAWDVVSGAECPRGDGAPPTLRYAAFNADGSRIATVEGNRIRTWDWPTGAVPLDPTCLAGSEVFGLCFRPGPSKELLTYGKETGLESKVECWDPNGKSLRNYRGHIRTVTNAAFRSDGRRLATASADFHVRIWDADKGEASLKDLIHPGYVSAVAYSPDGHRLATACSDGMVRLWDPESGRELLTLSGHKNQVTGVVFTSDGRWLVSCSQDGTLRLWDGGDPNLYLVPNERNSP